MREENQPFVAFKHVSKAFTKFQQARRDLEESPKHLILEWSNPTQFCYMSTVV